LLKYFDIPGLIKLANTEDPERITIRK